MMTADEAEALARKHRAVADAMERLARVQKWCKGVDPGHIVPGDLRVTWGLGSAITGYDDVTKIVTALVAPLIPDLLAKAVRKVETDLHVARQALPKSA